AWSMLMVARRRTFHWQEWPANVVRPCSCRKPIRSAARRVSRLVQTFGARRAAAVLDLDVALPRLNVSEDACVLPFESIGSRYGLRANSTTDRHLSCSPKVGPAVMLVPR